MKTALMMTAFLITSLIALGAWSAQGDRDDGVPFDQEVAEELLELRIKSSLLDALGWDAMTVDVEVTGGEVLLSGEVAEPATRKMAKQIAKSFDEVDSVKNEIRFERDTTETPLTDAVGGAEEGFKNAVLESRVKTQLLSELGRYGFRIEVEAAGGVVSLRGEVPDEKRREIALETASTCKGVDDVIDLLKVHNA